MEDTYFIRLQQIIDSIIAGFNLTDHKLQLSAQSLSSAYRQQQFDQALPDINHVLSYLAVRLPATYGVLYRVLLEIDDDTIQLMVDIGTGPGTAIWTVLDRWPSLQHVDAIEPNTHMMQMAKKIYDQLAPKIKINWHQTSIDKCLTFEPADLVVMNYSLGEIKQSALNRLINQVFDVAQKYIVIIEPGTPYGFKMIRQARDLLLNKGGFMVAPCTHNLACPLEHNDWCHFSQRIERTALHRYAKKADLNHEDEKYSYLIVSKSPIDHHSLSRVIKKPLQRSGHVRVDLCDGDGLIKKTFTRKDFDVYRQARRVMWGDLWKN